jgi:hypothetical protein
MALWVKSSSRAGLRPWVRHMKFGHKRMDEVRKSLVRQFHRLGVCPCLKDDLLVGRQALVYYTSMPYRLPNGGIAPRSQSGNNALNSSSVASLTSCI